MSNKLQIPQDYQESFFRLMDLIPASFRSDVQIQKDILLFLKLEGEEYVRQEIKKTKGEFKKKEIRRQMQK
jgi:hypothetical protein